MESTKSARGGINQPHLEVKTRLAELCGILALGCLRIRQSSDDSETTYLDGENHPPHALRFPPKPCSVSIAVVNNNRDLETRSTSWN